MIGSVRVACCNAASAMLLLARITSGASTAERKRGTHFSLAADPSSLSKGVQGRWSQNFRWPVLGISHRLRLAPHRKDLMRLFALAVTLSLAALVAASAQTATPFQISPKDLQRVLDGRLGLYPALPRMERLCPMHAS